MIRKFVWAVVSLLIFLPPSALGQVPESQAAKEQKEARVLDKGSASARTALTPTIFTVAIW